MSARTRAIRSGRVITLAVAFLAAPAAAQEEAPAEQASRYEEALARTSEALELLERAGLDAAVPLLESTLASCERGPSGEDCRRVALYALGYAHQTSAAGRPGDREALLRRAVEFFQEVRRENPDFAPASEALALAYRQMGAREWQEADLRELASGDDSGRYALLLGDYYRDRDLPERARDAYRRALDLAPSDPMPRSRLLALYRQDALPAAELVPILREWELRFPEVAAEGWVIAMRRLYPTSWRDAAEVLPHWLATQRSLDQLGPGLVKQVPEDWGAEPFAALRAFLLDPLDAPVPDWWRSTADRRDALAEVARALGHWRLADGDPAAAAATWDRGRDLATPGSAPWIQTTADLALLLDRSPDLDPDGDRFERLEFELFAGKGEAIATRDYEAMRRFHATLGVIYARRGQWGYGGSPRGARFQLERAIKAAADRAEETGVREPVPELHRLLAATHRANDRDDLAGTEYLRAALASLELDALEPAAEMLDSATALGALRAEADRGESITSWLAWRREAVDAARRGEPCAAGLLTRVRAAGGGAGRGLEPETVARQRFRVLTACARGAGRDGAALQAEALDGVLAERTPLIGVADLTRLELAREAVFRSFGQSVGRLEPAAGGGGERTLPLSLDPDGRVLYVDPGASSRTATRVVLELRPWETGVRLRIDDGTVWMLDAGTMRLLDLSTRLRSTTGVDAVRRPGGRR